MLPFSFVAAALAALTTPVDANAFLGAHPHNEPHSVAQELVRQTLASELGALASRRTGDLAEELRPVFASLPKNEDGNLEPSSVRYAVHRHFTKRYGWSVKGLSAGGEAWNASSPAHTLKQEHVPAYIQSLFEERIHSHGLDLQELAVFTATMADLIYAEARNDMEHIYGNLGLSTSDNLSFKEEVAVMDRFLVAYISGYHEEKGNFKEMQKEMEETLFGWDDMKMFARDQRLTFDFRRQQRNPFIEDLTFEDQAELAQDFVQNFQHFQQTECHGMKHKLLDMEHKGSGRVRLSDFYSGRRDPKWQFLESVDYLRAIGALDDSVPGRPSVIIPNYVTSASNCLSPSEFYDVCCRDECEDLLAQVESGIGQPSGAPSQIAEIIASVSSETVDAPRDLSSTQLARLEEIAQHHGDGLVPLHGRLFAQWMHHAYPRECPFPHLAGTTKPVTQDQWTGDAEASSREMGIYSSGKKELDSREESLEELMPWLAVEELVASHRHMAAARTQGWSQARLAFFLLGGISALVPVLRALGSLAPTSRGKLFKEKAFHQHLV